MKISTAKLGIIGGVIGMIAGATSSFIGVRRVERPLWGPPASPGEVVNTWTVFFFPIFVFAMLGLIGGVVTKERPVVGGVLMVIGGIGGFLGGLLWLPAGILLLIGGIRSLKQKT